MTGKLFHRYIETLSGCLQASQASRQDGSAMEMSDAMDWAAQCAHKVHDAGNKIMFIGNGGSSSISSHLSIDFAKNGNMRALTFSDAPMLTCLGNDLGYENVFAKPVEMYGAKGDMLIAISSSGGSANILNAVAKAREIGATVLTLSGFKPDNPLRQSGDVNLYVPSYEYGFVEVAHTALLHAVLDLTMGWTPENGLWENKK